MNMKLASLATCLLLSLSINAQTYYGQGYTIISEAVGGDDLSVVIYRQLPSGNVKNALYTLLAGTGWQLAEDYAADPMIGRLYYQQLPEQKQSIGPMPLEEVLQWISGPAWRLVVDPVNKLISYEVKLPYRKSRNPLPMKDSVETQTAVSTYVDSSLVTHEQTTLTPIDEYVYEPINTVPVTIVPTLPNTEQNRLIIGRRTIIAPESSYTFQNFGGMK